VERAKMPLANQQPPRLQDGICLRAAQSQDAKHLAAVFVSAWRHSYRGIVPEENLRSLDENEIADWLEKLIGSTSSTTTAAESAHHDVLGFCRHGPDPEDAGRGHIFSLYVAPAASGRGLGSYLLAHALADLERRHLDPVTIWVFEQNERARRLYTGFGFFPDATRRVEAEYGAEEIRLCRLGERAT
jgi:ribosomal protein S18 acetylase RimI-like enzyme